MAQSFNKAQWAGCFQKRDINTYFGVIGVIKKADWLNIGSGKNAC